MKFPKIGIRMVKSMIAVLICLLIDFLLKFTFGVEFALTYYSPFFASLAALYSLNNRKDDSIHLARLRSFGSIFGGGFAIVWLFVIFGLLTLLKMPSISNETGLEVAWYLLPAVPFDAPWFYMFIAYIMIALGILIIIYFEVAWNKHAMVFISALTYIATAVGNTTANPFWMYAINRTESTVIGVLISLAVNLFTFHFYRFNDLTIITGIDGILLKDSNELSNYQKYHLNNLMEDGLDLYFATNRSPATLIKLFNGVNLKRDLIIMNGSATFDLENKDYHNVTYIPKETELLINQVFDSFNVNYFSHTIIDNSLQIYYRGLKNSGDERFYQIRKNEYFRSFAKAVVHDDELVNYFISINDEVTSKAIKEKLEALHLDIHISLMPYKDVSGFYIMRVNAKKVDKAYTFQMLKQFKHHEFIVAIGSQESDKLFYQMANYRICFKDANPFFIKHADYVIDSNDPEALLKIIQKLYYKNNYLETLKTNFKTAK